MDDSDRAMKLLRAYLDFIHSPPDYGARSRFDTYLEALRAAMDVEMFHVGAWFRHASWRRDLQFLIQYGQGPNHGGPVEVMSGYFTGKEEGRVHSFHNASFMTGRGDAPTASYWSQPENVRDVQAGIARAEHLWRLVARGQPSSALRVATLALMSLRLGAPADELPDWLPSNNQPLKVTRKRAHRVAQMLGDVAPVPFSIPVSIFEQKSRNKAALVAQYLESQGLRPRQVAEIMRLRDIQSGSEPRRPASKLLHDWRTRHKAAFPREASRYTLREPDSHVLHVKDVDLQ